jgi:hypothetical protein
MMISQGSRTSADPADLGLPLRRTTPLVYTIDTKSAAADDVLSVQTGSDPMV